MSLSRIIPRLAAVTGGLVLQSTLLTSSLSAQALDSATVAGMRWRTVGPANFMGRLSDVVGIPSPSKTVFVAAAGGGIWKSTNNGITWRPTFDDKRIISMGMLAIAPSDTQQVWAGTGEPNSRNSIEPGGGIFKSTDGGLSWKPMGLEKTEHIGRIVVHPTNPDVVFVAALGAAWRSNPDRGLYKTTDGGQSWKLVKFISDKAGFVDVAIHPKNPNVLFATSWERRRTPYSLFSGGPGSGLFKSTDAGETWTEVKGGGFPAGYKGRMSLDINLANPDVMYMMIEAAANSTGPIVGERSPKNNGLWKSTDGGATWTQMNNINVRPFYYSQVRSDPKNPDRVYFSSTELQLSEDGGKTSRNAAQNVHVDDHGIWIDPNDPQRWFLANDGGIAITFDAGGNFNQAQNLPIAQFYEVAFDMAVPYNICGGAQDNGTWCGPSKRRVNQTSLGYWYTISGGDGFYAAMDPTDPNIVYGESQAGNVSRLNLKTGERYAFQKPSWQAKYKQWEDSIAIVRGDPLKAATKAQMTAITALRKLQAKDSTDLALRFNWNSPFFLSPHNPSVVYFGGNRVLKSNKRGEELQIISPDLAKGLTAKLDTALRLTGGITLDATGAETYGTVVALEESPAKPGLLYAGTDDGNVWKSSNDGATWENLAPRITGLPNNGEVYVTRIEASKFDENVVYVAFENHRNGDFKPYLFMSKDGGKSFTSIVNNLPADGNADFLHVVREDPTNADVLYVGSSLSVYASVDRGATWTKFAAGLPSVPVYDLQIHPRDRELIAATHGRGFWIVDVAPLQQITKTVAAKPVHLFQPKTAFQWGEEPLRGGSGNGNAQGFFATPNPAYGANISYRITQAGSPARISILNAVGDTISSIAGPGSVGVHTVTWNFSVTGRPAPRAPLSPSEKRDSILRAVRMPLVLDSLAKAKYDSTALALAKQLLNPPAGGFNFRGGGGGRGAQGPCERPLTQWDPFCARPAEATPRPAAAAAAGGQNVAELQQRAAQMQGAASNPAVRKVFELIGLPVPAQGRGFGGFGGGGSVATTGDYGIVLQIGNTIQKQTLRIENMGGVGGVNPFGFENDEGK
ncbi:WD40/YVTN/BNR-like repeat-containing protein [Gemmatimonas phototrophica]|uniref:Sortilin N-terminal domain-containing protein n=1 Tax=Gemmatimonas phototrophica TaxID=1379270 RepID=A0A143BN07_9BACT|nr:hypothetical protein [Gemmatimonas phototrophica]AMW05880.1 hypothetical protein GEMMAAP_15935 [Gemmatimonas phototrophica]